MSTVYSYTHAVREGAGAGSSREPGGGRCQRALAKRSFSGVGRGVAEAVGQRQVVCIVVKPLGGHCAQETVRPICWPQEALISRRVRGNAF
eukprot:5848331-Prymnesium_polylepis.3